MLNKTIAKRRSTELLALLACGPWSFYKSNSRGGPKTPDLDIPMTLLKALLYNAILDSLSAQQMLILSYEA